MNVIKISPNASGLARNGDEITYKSTGFAGEALGAEEVGVVPVFGGAVHDVLAEEEVGAGWDAEFVGVTGLVE